MKQEIRQKLEAIIRAEVDNAPYKYRDVRAMYLYGITPYKDMSEEEINEMFEDMELEITPEDKEWATYEIDGVITEKDIIRDNNGDEIEQ